MVNTSVSPSARVQIVPAPIVSPGNCGLCGKSQHPAGFADPRLDFEFYGTLYFCADCVGDFARTFGFIDESQYQHLLDNICDIAEQLDWYKAQFDRLRSVLGEQFVPHPPIASHSSGDGNGVSVPSQQESEQEQRVVIAVKPKDARGESAPLKLVSEQDSDGVSSATGDDGSTDPLGL